ncbi:MAG: elongation factor P [Patescibacteria group bacterium]|nr:elongation factor P [Patescibacteria group bacterium]
MATITTSDFKKGLFILFKDEPHQIVEFQHVNPGKGSAFVRTRLKSIKTGRVQEFTYKSGESVEELFIETREMQYLYNEGDSYIFMDNQTYEQSTVPQSLLGEFIKFLKPNDIYQIMIYEEQPVGIRFPKKIRLLVTEAHEAARGDTVGGAMKLVKVETGAEISVPLFIKEGDVIAIDSETGTYVERVN